MDKTITSREYAVFLRELRTTRKRSGLTQVDLAARLGETQSFVSKCERGERRLDIVELRAFCRAFGLSLPAFVQQFEQILTPPLPSRAGRRRA
ncbi:MAG: helix-turn-helix transcriptional regulator [bacterium]|nr:helix-turn-helix transcriptional regulator [bacterium]